MFTSFRFRRCSVIYALIGYLCIAVLGCGRTESYDERSRVLLFTKTEGFRHASIPYGVDAIQKLGNKYGFEVVHTERADAFTEANLETFDAIIFLSTSGDVLNPYQQAHMERFVQAGGGFVGIHAAASTEHDWPWYGRLVGAYVDSLPPFAEVTEASIAVASLSHPATDSLPPRWKRTDEWFRYRMTGSGIEELLHLDGDGTGRPVAWYHEYDGGRAFYTGGGHTHQSFSEPLFLNHLWGGLRYVLGDDLNNHLQYRRARTPAIPEETRFSKVVLDEFLTEPMELEVLDEDRVLFAERRGIVKLYDASLDTTKVVATLDLFTELEDGLMGLAKDPGFESNRWVYLYYSPAGPVAVQYLSRFRMVGDSLDMNSEQRILTVPTQREECCHSGGSIEFDTEGNLYLSTGDNTNPFASDGYAPIDERPGREYWDDQRTAANTNDLRGKILRIHPENDGSYTIPEGNLFGQDRENARPEIYVMGNRNPYRISIDPVTGFLYWGEVGPDAGEDSDLRGPRGYDEINQARSAGNFGWPYFIADNKAYRDYDFSTKESGPFFDPDRPVNESVNNSGLRELPPARKAFIWYPYAASAEFPLVGSGGRTAMAGPVYHPDRYRDHPSKFPDYYKGKLFIYEWVRNWMMAVTMDEDHHFKKMEPFMPSSDFDRPVDMQFGPSGRLYLIEYGTTWYQQNPDARLVRIDYNAGNRAPVAAFTARNDTGAAPLTVHFSAEPSMDYDNGDSIEYEWDFGAGSGGTRERDPSFLYEEPGVYTASLTVTDSHGASSTTLKTIRVGNEPPEVAITLSGNRSFYRDGEQRTYRVRVSDREDGSLASGGIAPDEVAVGFSYLDEDLRQALGHRSAATNALSGRRLIEAGECQACHLQDETMVGPAYRAIADRYREENVEESEKILARKIIEGGSGNWGERAMPAHPELTQEQAAAMAGYILSVGRPDKNNGDLPVQGTLTVNEPEERGTGNGGFLLRAGYTDRGANGIEPLTGQAAIGLRYPRLPVLDADEMEIATRWSQDEDSPSYALANDGSYFRFSDIDLTGVDKLVFSVKTTGKAGAIEVRSGSISGELLAGARVPEAGGEMEAEAHLAEMEGMHDLYFVVDSETHPGETLFLVESVFFELE